MLPQIFAPIFLEKIVMQKLLQNFAQKQSENLLNAKKTQNYAEKFMQKKNGKSLNFLTHIYQTKELSTPIKNLRCFVARQFLSQIYSLFWRTF